MIWAGLASAQTSITFQYFYDDTGQLIKVVDSTGVVIEYIYDAVGNILEVKRSTITGPLHIFSFTPQHGGVGTVVTIYGQGFSPTRASNSVQFAGTAATVTSATSATLVVSVPAGAVTGKISVTVAGNTAVSISNFSVLQVPLITSIMPNLIDATLPTKSIQVTGSNFTGSSFSFLPALFVTLGVPEINPAGTLATLPITVEPIARGLVVLVASNSQGSSDMLPTSRNTAAIVSAQEELDTDGDGYLDGLELVFRSDPFDTDSVPNFTVLGELLSPTVSVLNNALPLSEQHQLSPAVSVLNNALPLSFQQTLLSAAVSVLNSVLPLTRQSITRLTQRTVGGEGLDQQTTGKYRDSQGRASTQPQIRIEDTTDASPSKRRLIEGETISFRVDLPTNQRPDRVVFFVNDVDFATDERPPFSFTFTVPYRVSKLKFSAQVQAGTATQQTEAVTFDVVPQSLITVAGRARDDFGKPIQGATVQLLVEGLHAEFFDAAGVTSLPNLEGRHPDFTGSVTAINLRNPNGIFNDPLGTNLARDFAARFTAWLKVSAPGSYMFSLGVGGGARLKIDDVTVIDISNSKGGYLESSNAVDLSVGWVPIELTYYQGAGNVELQLSYAPPDGERQVITSEMFLASSPDLNTMSDELGNFSISNVSNAFSGVRVLGAITKDGVTRAGSSDRLIPKDESPLEARDIVLKVQR